MTAYYNEIDPFAAAWLRELIKAGLIAPGEVDERSIEEVKPDDLRGFTQCHFFAGIGGWSYALRLAGVSDDEPVWTGSCPCPPFSSAGKRKACPQCSGTNPLPHVGRTGFFVCCLCGHEWLADARHLYPELWRLIRDGRPVKFFGEQVASDDGRTWLASVRASLEILGYEVGAADICSAGVGSADIRQRLYFVADTASTRQTRRKDGRTDSGDARPRLWSVESERSGAVGELGESNGTGSQSRREGSAIMGYGSSAITASGLGKLGITTKGRRGSRRTSEEIHGQEPCGETERSSNAGELGNAKIKRERPHNGQSGESGRQQIPARGSGVSSELAQPDFVEPSNGELQRGRRLLQPSENPLTGFWSNAEWIFCRDEKWRPVEPGTFPLVNGATNRVGRLRGYGNAINAEVAKAFIEAYMSLISTE